MTIDTLFELADFEETVTPAAVPAEMWPCGAHAKWREVDEHARDCWGGVCPSCGDDVPSGTVLLLNHGGAETGACTSLGLRLNHLTYDIRHGQIPHARDLTALDRGWRIAPDGSQIPPAGIETGHGWHHVWNTAEGWARWIGSELR